VRLFPRPPPLFDSSRIGISARVTRSEVSFARGDQVDERERVESRVGSRGPFRSFIHGSFGLKRAPGNRPVRVIVIQMNNVVVQLPSRFLPFIVYRSLSPRTLKHVKHDTPTRSRSHDGSLKISRFSFVLSLPFLSRLESRAGGADFFLPNVTAQPRRCGVTRYFSVIAAIGCSDGEIAADIRVIGTFTGRK